MKRAEHIKEKIYDINKKGLLICVNTLFILYFVLHLFGMTYLEGIVVGIISVILPGIGWVMLMQSRVNNTVVRLITAVLITTIIWIIGLFFIKFIGSGIELLFFAIYLFVVTNIGCLLVRKDMHLSLSQYHIVIFIIVVPLLAVNALSMDVIWDADAPLIVTSYGLIYDLIPYSDLWGQKYEFQHPPWAHFISSFSIYMMGYLDDVKDHYTRARMLYNVGFEDPYERTHTELEQKRELLFSGRIPHCIVAGLLLIILFEIVKRETQSPFYGLCTVLLFLNPEIIVRFSHAFYITPTFFILLAMCYSFLYVPRNTKILFLFGFWSAWINQKSVIVPLACIGSEFFRLDERKIIKSFFPFIGFITGYVSFCYYGAQINWHSLSNAFLVRHGIPGLIMKSDIMGFVTSWTRAILFFNPIIFILGIITIIYLTRKKWHAQLSLFFWWFYIGFCIFILCVSPHIKNCSYVYIPLVISLMYFISKQKKIVQWYLLWGIILVHCFNMFLLNDTLRRPNEYYVTNDENSVPIQSFVNYAEALDRIFP